MNAPTYSGFRTWHELHAYIRSGARVFYQAPMDLRPSGVYTRIFKNGKIRVTPENVMAADPFTADEFHLDRFRRMA